MKCGGTYALVILSEAMLHLKVGRLGVHKLLPGHYLYVGSALGGLSGRLQRHLKSEKRLHWHIDYLLQKATIAEIWFSPVQLTLECSWNRIVIGLPGAKPSIPGFGASDCRCPAHLTYFPETPSFDLFGLKLRDDRLPQAYRIDVKNLTNCEIGSFFSYASTAKHILLRER